MASDTYWCLRWREDGEWYEGEGGLHWWSKDAERTRFASLKAARAFRDREWDADKVAIVRVTRRRKPRSELAALVKQLEPDAQQVLLEIARRLVAGRRQYGDLSIADDQRDWREELLAELLDGTVYGAVALIQARGRRT